jgi:Tfp pilus assembly protein PilF
LLRLERVAPAYDHAAAARALANLYWKAPALVSVGSSKKAELYFQAALARDPTFPGNQAMAAAFFADRRDCARARPLADAVARRSDLDAFGPDAPVGRRLADEVRRDCR